MTISSTTSKKTYPYTGPGSYSFPFQIKEESNITVTHIDTNGIVNPLMLNSDFTVTTVDGVNGGTVVLTYSVAIGGTLVIERILPLTQETKWVNGGPFDQRILEEDLDRMVMLIQQVNLALTEIVNAVPQTFKPFSSATARDAFFVDNPSLLVEGVITEVVLTPNTTQKQRYIGGAWVTQSNDHAVSVNLDLANSGHTYTPDERGGVLTLRNAVQEMFSRVFDRRKALIVSAESSKQRIVCFGDSNTWYGSDPVIAAASEPYYSSVLQDLLRLDSSYVINQGVPGDTVAMMRARFDRDVADRYVDDAENILLVTVGINDAKIPVTVTDYYTDLAFIVDSAQALGYTVFVSLYPPHNNNFAYNSTLQFYNAEIVSQNANRATPFNIIDLVSLVSSDGGASWDNPALVGSSGVHWTTAGQSLIGNFIYDQLVATGHLSRHQVTGDSLLIQGSGLFNESVSFKEVFDNGNSGSSATIDFGIAQKQKITIDQSTTLSFTPPQGVGDFRLTLLNPSLHLITWPLDVKWLNGTVPSLTARDILSVYWDGVNYNCILGEF